jgi:hypothetical protein
LTAFFSSARLDMTVKMVVPTVGSLVCSGGVRSITEFMDCLPSMKKAKKSKIKNQKSMA